MRLLPPGEVIGPASCPIMTRWTLWDRLGLKLIVHHFHPGADDPDCHDHPRSFVTFVLRGGYDDVVPCDGHGQHDRCLLCIERDGDKLGDRLRGFTVRFRSAEHMHRTLVHDDGAWTVVVMGKLRRPWGFIREGMWWPVKEYERVFGLDFRCDPEDGPDG